LRKGATEAKKETVVVARNLQNGCIEVSCPGRLGAKPPPHTFNAEDGGVHQQGQPRVAKG
jgi:hypothetical protein